MQRIVSRACNHPNLLVLPFSFELVRPAAYPTWEVRASRSPLDCRLSRQKPARSAPLGLFFPSPDRQDVESPNVLIEAPPRQLLAGENPQMQKALELARQLRCFRRLFEE